MANNEFMVHVQDIAWDCDSEEEFEDLPTELDISSNDLDIEILVKDENEISDWEIEEAISDYLSDTYGYCHNGFYWNKA